LSACSCMLTPFDPIDLDLLEVGARDGHCVSAVDWTRVGATLMTS
jgi:hypothetical protein